MISASILSADFGRLAEEVAAVEEAGVDWIHVDVMDGRFVPNLTIGPPVVAAIRRATRLPLDVHLMIAEPDRYIDAFIEAGADWLGVHAEAAIHLHRSLQSIREKGARGSVALNPATPLCAVEHVLAEADMVLVMTVNPGFGGQEFIAEMLPKVRRCRQMIDDSGRDVKLAVDGGVHEKTIDGLIEAGVDVFVAGSAIFGGGDPDAAIRTLRAHLPA
jgi:ribulose-phosphate 3-epimerase